MKKLLSKLAHNRPQTFFFQYCQPAKNQPKYHILFHKNGSLRDFYIMTLVLTIHYIFLYLPGCPDAPARCCCACVPACLRAYVLLRCVTSSSENQYCYGTNGKWLVQCRSMHDDFCQKSIRDDDFHHWNTFFQQHQWHLPRGSFDISCNMKRCFFRLFVDNLYRATTQPYLLESTQRIRTSWYKFSGRT